jgi:AbrB family looped-hinge helix DNA binding protein
MVVHMRSESKIDEKGRICIPSELRKKLGLNPGEKVIFQLDQNIIKIKKAVTPEEFTQNVKSFHEEVKKVRKEPIPFEKILE